MSKPIQKGIKSDKIDTYLDTKSDLLPEENPKLFPDSLEGTVTKNPLLKRFVKTRKAKYLIEAISKNHTVLADPIVQEAITFWKFFQSPAMDGINESFGGLTIANIPIQDYRKLLEKIVPASVNKYKSKRIIRCEFSGLVHEIPTKGKGKAKLCLDNDPFREYQRSRVREYQRSREILIDNETGRAFYSPDELVQIEFNPSHYDYIVDINQVNKLGKPELSQVPDIYSTYNKTKGDHPFANLWNITKKYLKDNKPRNSDGKIKVYNYGNESKNQDEKINDYKKIISDYIGEEVPKNELKNFDWDDITTITASTISCLMKRHCLICFRIKNNQWHTIKKIYTDCKKDNFPVI